MEDRGILSDNQLTSSGDAMNRFNKWFWRRWSITRVGLIVGFLSGVGITISIFVLKEISPAFVSPPTYDILGQLQQVVSIPGVIVEEVIGYDEPFSERLSIAHLSFFVVTNGVLLSLMVGGIAWIWKNRARVFASGIRHEELAASRKSPALSRKLYRFMSLGFVFGLTITVLAVGALVIPAGETAIGWLGVLAWPYISGLATGIASVLGWNLETSLRGAPVVLAVIVALTNGVAFALCGAVLFWLGNACWKSKEQV